MKKSLQSLGGEAVIGKNAPDLCARCGMSMSGRSWHSFLGHLGLHGLADKYFEGDIKVTQKHLRENGLARQDPFPGNGAWRRYLPIDTLVFELDLPALAPGASVERESQ